MVKRRVRTPLGENCQWRDTKRLRLIKRPLPAFRTTSSIWWVEMLNVRGQIDLFRGWTKVEFGTLLVKSAQARGIGGRA